MIGIKGRERQFKKRGGFSLIEIVVSVTLFSVIILSVTSIFKLVIDSQRSALAAQNVQENIKYFLEVIGKEMRMAQKNKGNCAIIPDEDIFAITSVNSDDSLFFRNYDGECVSYSLADDGGNTRFLVSRGVKSGFISPAKIAIDGLHFSISGGTTTQAIVTINLRAHAVGSVQFKSDMIIQTSISSRYYKE
ncbi:MAG: type II secretion system protein [Patescibacteria group bacterium]